MSIPSYLPDVWQDDVKMHGLMSYIKERSVNTVDYDRKIKFWSEVINDSCIGEQNAIFNLSSLKRRFRRGDRVPASLNTIIDILKLNGNVVTLDEWKTKHSSWLDWGLSKTKNWMFGISTDEEKFVHVPTLKNLGAELLKFYNTELRSEIDCTSEIITYNDLLERSSSLIATQETFDLVLDHLSDIGELSTGTTKTGEKVLKFKDHGSKGPVTFTEADASLVDIRKAMTRLDRDIIQIEEKVKKFDKQCRECLRKGDKSRAQNFLRQRKRAEKDIADKDAQYQKLLTMLHQISSAKNNKDVISAYQSGTAAFKEALARQGLTPDKIHETMDDVANSLDEFKEIEEAISSPVNGMNRITDDDLEKELNELLSQNRNESISLPDAPSNKFGLFQEEPEENEQEQLEKRLARLREVA